LNFNVNGIPVKKSFSYLDIPLNFSLEIPLNSEDNITVSSWFEGAGNLLDTASQDYIVSIQKYDHDLKMVNYKINSEIVNKNNTITATIANIGKNTEYNIPVILYDSYGIGINGYNNVYDTVYVPVINPGEIIEVNLTLMPINNYYLYLAMSVNAPFDTNPDNDGISFEMHPKFQGSNLYPSVSYVNYPLLVNIPNQLRLYVINSGMQTATNVSYKFYIFDNPPTNFIFEGINELNYNGINYLINLSSQTIGTHDVVIRYNDTIISKKLFYIDVLELDNNVCFVIDGMYNNSIQNVYYIKFEECTLTSSNLPDIAPSEFGPYSTLIDYTPTESGEYNYYISLVNDEEYLNDNFNHGRFRVTLPGYDLSISSYVSVSPTTQSSGNLTIVMMNEGSLKSPYTTVKIRDIADFSPWVAEANITRGIYYDDIVYRLTITPDTENSDLSLVSVSYANTIENFSLYTMQSHELNNSVIFAIGDKYNSKFYVIFGKEQFYKEVPIPEIDPSSALMNYVEIPNSTLPEIDPSSALMDYVEIPNSTLLEHTLFFDVFLEGDIYAPNNFGMNGYQIETLNPDVGIQLGKLGNFPHHVIVNQTAYLNFSVMSYNRYNASDIWVTVNLTYFGEETPETTNILHTHLDLLEGYGSVPYSLNFTPMYEGFYDIKMSAELENDDYFYNNYQYIYFRSMKNESNLQAHWDIRPFYDLFVIDNSNNIGISLYNDGFVEVKNISMIFYVDNNAIINESNINIPSFDYESYNYNFTPTQKKYYNLSLQIFDENNNSNLIYNSEQTVPAVRQITTHMQLTDMQGNPQRRYIITRQGELGFFNGTANINVLDEYEHFSSYLVDEENEEYFGFITPYSSFNETEELTTQLLWNVDSDNLHADLIYLNSPSWQYEQSEIKFVINLNQHSINTNNITVFGCNDYNYQNNSCLSTWEEINNKDVILDNNNLYVRAWSNNYKAIALGREITNVSPSLNTKLQSKYSPKEAFLISDKNWQDVLSLVSVTT